MGCSGDKVSSIHFYIELFSLIPDKNNIKCFQIKSVEKIKFEKTIEKKLLDYISESKITKNNFLEENFQFSINNSLFYIYLGQNPIIKNFVQVKDVEPFNFENLSKISILLTKNYDKLCLQKKNIIDKTKFVSDLNNLKLDFTNLGNQKIFDPNLTIDNFVLTKPNLTENLSEINEENEKENLYNNEQSNEKEQNYNDSDDDSIIEEEDDNINENNEENVFVKNYIHITGELTADTVKDVYMKLSLFKNENNSYENYESFIKGRKSIASICNDDILNKRKSGISIVDDNILAKKGKEINLKLEQKEFESCQDSEDDQNKDEKNKDNSNNDNDNNNNKNIIDSIFIENVKKIDFELFSELIEILTDYPHLKRLSFCDFQLEKEFEGWEGLIHLINENNSIRWLDFHKSNINNYLLEEICNVLEYKRIRYLDISENFINQEGAKAIGEFLKKNKTLQRLIINNNDLEDFKKEGINSICEPLLIHPNIELLDFSSMTITGCGEYIANLIKRSHSIKVITLKDCTLNLKDFQHICRALSSDNISQTIINVDLSYNDMASDKSLEEVGKMIKINKTLTKLNLEKMNLNMTNYNFIFEGLNQNETITNFSFCFNPNIKPRIILDYFLHRKKLNALAYIPYKASINEKGPKVEFTLEEKKLIEKFKKKRKKVKLITR